MKTSTVGWLLVAAGFSLPAMAPAQTPPAPAPEAVVTAPAPPAAPAAPAPAPAPAGEPAKDGAAAVDRVPVGGNGHDISKTGDLITISLNDVPLSDVVSMFIRISGANIVANPTSLTGRVTANLKDVDWKIALDEILQQSGLTLSESQPGSGVYNIAPPKPAQQQPVFPESFELKYIQAASITSGLTKLLMPNGSLIHASGKNISVLATTKQAEDIKNLLEKLDRMIAQVAIEAKFVELNDQAIKDLGINWTALEAFDVTLNKPAMDMQYTKQKRGLHQDAYANYTTRNDSDYRSTDSYSAKDDNGNSEALITRNRNTSLSDLVGGITVGGMNFEELDLEEGTIETVPPLDVTRTTALSAVLSAEDFALTLSALKQNSGAEIVTNPKVVVSSGEMANIHVGEKRPNVVRKTNSTQAGTAEVTYEFGVPPWIEIGALVNVTPVVNTESNITVKIEPQLDRQVGVIEPTPGLTFPILVTRRIKSEFVLQSGQTVAIGGLTTTTEGEVVKKIPFLGDIPVIGKYLFSHTHTEKEQDETIIFVTVGLTQPEKMSSLTGVPSHGALIYEKYQNEKGEIELRNRRRPAPGAATNVTTTAVTTARAE